MSGLDPGKKKDGIFAPTDRNDNQPYSIAKIDCCFDVDGKITSLEAKKEMMKAVGVDMKKMAGNKTSWLNR